MVEDRWSMRLDAVTRRRLDQLAAKLELSRADIIRQALKAFAKRHGIDDATPTE